MDPAFKSLFEPLEMPNLKINNRFYMAPMATGFGIERAIHYFTARAKGGVALITTGETSVHPGGRAGIKNELLMESDDDIKKLAPLADSVKKAGAKIILQLNHAGRYSPGYAVGGQSVAPSAVMSGYTGETPRELSTIEVDELVAAFAKAALRARQAGFDGVEFLGSSGYLISQFFSPLTNKRADKFGGDILGRANFILSILEETRKLVGSDFNICVKFDADDGMQGGITLEESKIIAPALVGAGADRLHVWAGWHESTRPMLLMTVLPGAFSPFAFEIKKTVNVPVSAVGRINDPYVAAKIIIDGYADLIGLGRALIADPEFVRKIRENRIKEIRKCYACCRCFDSLLAGLRKGENSELTCSVNPELGHEGENLIIAANKPKRIVIAGAGPAGLEAARTASVRGHKVILYEKDSQIGGLVNLSFVPPHKDELKSIIEYYKNQIELNKINFRLNTAFDVNVLRNINPDVLVIAAGADAAFPDIPGITNDNVFTAIDVLKGNVKTGDQVVIIGGGMIGLETAEFLADKGIKVTIIEMKSIAADVGATTRWALISRIRRKMTIYSSSTVLKIMKNSVLISGKDKKEKEIYADSVVLAAGMASNRSLIKEIEDLNLDIEYYIAGSCKKPGQIYDAIKDGFEIGCRV